MNYMKKELLILCMLGACGLGMANSQPVSLKVNGLSNPLGIDTPNPTFSWQTKSDERGFLQSAYEIDVKTAEGVEVWTSGRVGSSLQTQIVYEGAPLKSCTPYVWSVRVYGKDGKAASGTEAANFPGSYTIQTSDDNKSYVVAHQVTNGAAPSFVNASLVIPYLGRNFSIASDRKVKRARIYASALGVFTMTLNGQPVTANKLEPGESEYEKTILYSTYDVTSLVQQGDNTLLARVAGGIFSQNHCMMDHIEEWFFSQLGGVRNAGVGFDVVHIEPWIPGDMTRLDVTTRGIYGNIGCRYERLNDGDMVYTFDIPANSQANILSWWML